MLESDLVRKILATLRLEFGGVWFKIHGGANQEAGIPDIIGCYRGRFVAFEVKRGKHSRVSPRQRLVLDRISDAGGLSVVVESPLEASFALRNLSHDEAN